MCMVNTTASSTIKLGVQAKRISKLITGNSMAVADTQGTIARETTDMAKEDTMVEVVDPTE